MAAVPRSSVAGQHVIQPGSSITTLADGGYCTLNWIYDEVLTEEELEVRDPRVLAGTAAHCVSHVGEEIALATGSLGDPTLIFGEVAYIDDDLDYSFISVQPEFHGLVEAGLRGHPEIPTGISTVETSTEGDLMQFSGHGVGFHLTEQTQQERVGVLNYNDGLKHDILGPVTNGDSGGPVANLTDNGKAFGIVNTVGAGFNTEAMAIVLAGEGGLSLEGILLDAARADLDLELRTVGSGGRR